VNCGVGADGSEFVDCESVCAGFVGAGFARCGFAGGATEDVEAEFDEVWDCELEDAARDGAPEDDDDADEPCGEPCAHSPTLAASNTIPTQLRMLLSYRLPYADLKGRHLTLRRPSVIARTSRASPRP
jgi:hypothetical protein